MKSLIFSIPFIVFTCHLNAQLPVDQYRKDIQSLTTYEEKQAYWKIIDSLDQQVWTKSKTRQERDSISIDNMIRTALMLEIHGKEILTPNVFVHVLNLSHNYFGDSNLAFWPVIKASKEQGGGTIEQFYPAYVLESIGLTFYGFSFLGKDEMYDKALRKLNNYNTNTTVVEDLTNAFETQKHIHSLQQKESVGEWHMREFAGRDNERGFKFQFLRLEDGQLYLKKFKNLHRLILVNQTNGLTYYRVENEPFGWMFQLDEDGNLKLLNENEDVLIVYTKSS